MLHHADKSVELGCLVGRSVFVDFVGNCDSDGVNARHSQSEFIKHTFLAFVAIAVVMLA